MGAKRVFQFFLSLLYFLRDLIEDTVDEGRRFFGAEFLGELDRFVDGDFRRDIRAVGEFEDGSPHDVPVHPVYPAEAPVFSVLSDQPVEIFSVLGDTFYNSFREVP